MELARLGVSWETEKTLGDAPGRLFSVGPGRALLPLDSSAWWRAALGARALTFTISDPEACTSIAISDLSVWERVE